jgi:parallel beta-helix repeat protein
MRIKTAFLLTIASIAWSESKIDRSDVLAAQADMPSTSATTRAANRTPSTTPATLPTTPVNCTTTLGPDDKWQLAVDRAKPGDTICFHGGDYKNSGRGQLYEACLSINNSGEPSPGQGLPGKPITLRNVPGEKPVFYGNSPLIWAIRIGYVKHTGEQRGVHDVIVDGLHATQAPWDGIEIAHSYNVAVRNCWSYTNNFNSPNGYKAGVNIDAGHDITIDHCRVFDNGFGICGYEDQPDGHEWPNPSGPDHVTLSNNFVFSNSRTGNLGNSPGMDIRFATRCTYEGNIFYDNPDAGINGEGNNFCRVLRNICINNWQPGGNNEGMKICVRGGGGNVIAFNLLVNNGNCGFDATSGVGDVFLNNTCYGNGSWGILAEGRETMLFNNISADNSKVVDNAYPELAATGWSLISDWNVFGRGPLTSTRDDTLTTLPPHTKIQPVRLTGVKLPRTDLRQINTPEMLWGVSTIEAARAKILAAYKPSVAIMGTTLDNVQARCNQNIPTVKAAIDAVIEKAASSLDFQMKQATSRWQALKAGLKEYDLSGLKDLGGQPINGSVPIRVGAAQ